MRVELIEKFRYVHEPLKNNNSSIPFLKHQEQVNKLKERIQYSTGGAFLITGFRGVGKTTVVERALEELTCQKTVEHCIIPVFTSVARPLSPTQLMFEMIRRLMEALIDYKILENLPINVSRAIILAYTRTSLSIKHTNSKSVEETYTLGMDGKASNSVISNSITNLIELLPKFNISKKKLNSLAMETTFLAYTDADVEHDFIRIADLLTKNDFSSHTLWERILTLFKARKKKNRKLKFVFVLDELDKLTGCDNGLLHLNNLLSGMKNILSLCGICFVFVGGIDLYDCWLKDTLRGNSIYESTFAWQMYIPCIWTATESFIYSLVKSSGSEFTELETFINYLNFKGRGIPRRMLQEFNSFVQWEANQPYIEFSDFDIKKITFFTRLQNIIYDFQVNTSKLDYMPTLEVDKDRRYLVDYYITDWVLRTECKEFSVRDIYVKYRSESADSAINFSIEYAEKLINHLFENKIIKEIRGVSDSQTVIQDVPCTQARLFQLSESIWEELSKYELKHNQEKVKTDSSNTEFIPLIQPFMKSSTMSESNQDVVKEGKNYYTDKSIILRVNQRYKTVSVIGRGGMGIVYKAYDTVLRRDVAIKVLPVSIRNDSKAVERFIREARIAGMLKHPNIVRTLDILEASDERDYSIAIVMELIEGINLQVAIENSAFDAKKSVGVILQLLRALDYVYSKGLCRLDIKPSNIIVDEDGRAILVDFGLAKMCGSKNQVQDYSITQTHIIVGTPMYMAPEQFGSSNIDIRTDIYSLGIVLFELLSGKRPLNKDKKPKFFYEISDRSAVVSELNVSEELKRVILKATNPEPADRFSTPMEMIEILAHTPEGAGFSS